MEYRNTADQDLQKKKRMNKEIKEIITDQLAVNRLYVRAYFFEDTHRKLSKRVQKRADEVAAGLKSSPPKRPKAPEGSK